MDVDGDTQVFFHPEIQDYIYLSQVDASDAVYIRRIISYHGVSDDGYHVVTDDFGVQQLVQRRPVKDFGHAKAWQAVQMYS
ncbi:MAG: hypothetical protein AAF558_01235 [Verrucomicrobiota bacterium]